MKIDRENYDSACSAVRDILFMYVDLVEGYGGFGHGIDVGTFRPLDFLEAELVEPPAEGYVLGPDVDLLHAGSGIALLCELSDAFYENDATGDVPSPAVQAAKAAFLAGRLRHLPSIERAFELGLAKDQLAFRRQLTTVYREYVVGYFTRLAAEPINLHLEDPPIKTY